MLGWSLTESMFRGAGGAGGGQGERGSGRGSGPIGSAATAGLVSRWVGGAGDRPPAAPPTPWPAVGHGMSSGAYIMTTALDICVAPQGCYRACIIAQKWALKKSQLGLAAGSGGVELEDRYGRHG